MKALRPMLRAALAALLATVAVSAAAADLDSKFDPKRLVTPPLGKIQTVKPEQLALPNGLTVYLLENHDLPLVSGSAYVLSSPVWTPKEKWGLAQIMGETMRRGGTQAHPGDWLDDRLAAIGATISTSHGVDFASGYFRCLSDNTDEVVGLFAEILRQPAFPDDKIELSKVGLRQEIASRNDEMFSIINRVAAEAVFGKGSPYAPLPEYVTVEAVTRDDCMELHRNVFEPSRIVLAVYGDFKSAEMKQLLTARFGDWKGAKAAFPTPPPMPEMKPSRLFFAPKEDVTQSGILVAHLGFRADDPDYPSMDVFQMALGGGFQSRLVNRIRTQRGLAYATGASAGEGYQRPGVFLAYSLTRSDSTMMALDLLREEVGKVVQAPFTDEELKTAKESVQNTFVFNFEDPAQVLFRSAYYQVVGYPQDFLDRYQKGLDLVTAQSVLDAAKRKVHPDKLLAVVVGKEQDFDRPLAAMGLPLERVDITIPPPPSKVAVATATPEALARGRAWLAKAAELAGGSAAWKAVKTSVVEQQATLSMQGQSLTIGTKVQWALPDRVVVTQTLPMGEVKQGSDGTNGWVSAMGEIKDQPKVAEEMKREYERSLFRLFSNPAAVPVQALDQPQTVDGVTYNVAFVKSELVRDLTLFFAPDGRLARVESQGEGPMGPAKQTEIYDVWQPVSGIQYPSATRMLMDGKPFMEGKVTAVSFNEPLADDLFKKPEK